MTFHINYFIWFDQRHHPMRWGKCNWAHFRDEETEAHFSSDLIFHVLHRLTWNQTLQSESSCYRNSDKSCPISPLESKIAANSKLFRGHFIHELRKWAFALVLENCTCQFSTIDPSQQGGHCLPGQESGSLCLMATWVTPAYIQVWNL